MKVGLLGGGSWGTTVAHLTSQNCPTRMWARRAETVDEINNHHTNKKYLPNAQLHPDLKATYEIKDAVHDADVSMTQMSSSWAYLLRVSEKYY